MKAKAKPVMIEFAGPVRIPFGQETGGSRLSLSLDPLDGWFEKAELARASEVTRALHAELRARPPKHEIERITEFRIRVMQSDSTSPGYIGAGGALIKDRVWQLVEMLCDWKPMTEYEALQRVNDRMKEPQRLYRSGLILQHEYRVIVERRVVVHEDVSLYFEDAHLHN